MRYFATASGPRVREAMRCGLLDQITTPASRNRIEPGVTWCADNGIYSAAYPGDARYLAWLAGLPYPERCRFAVAPDVVADHAATVARSGPMLARIRQLGLPVALCAQNGAEPDTLPWAEFDVVFLAGIAECLPCGYRPAVAELPLSQCPAGHWLSEWKTGPTAAAITREATQRRKQVHMGRVNTAERMLIAKRMGCDSADGTYLAHGPDTNLPNLLRWLCEPPTRSAVQLDLLAHLNAA